MSRRSDPDPIFFLSQRSDESKTQLDPKPCSPLSVPKIELPDALMDMQTLFAGFNLLLWFREERVTIHLQSIRQVEFFFLAWNIHQGRLFFTKRAREFEEETDGDIDLFKENWTERKAHRFI